MTKTPRGRCDQNWLQINNEMFNLSFLSSLILHLVNISSSCGENKHSSSFFFPTLQMQHLCTCWVLVMHSCLRSKPLTKSSTPGLLVRLFREVSRINHRWLTNFIDASAPSIVFFQKFGSSSTSLLQDAAFSTQCRILRICMRPNWVFQVSHGHI